MISSRASGRIAERLTALSTIALPTIDASTVGRSIGSRASGRARLTCGSRANASTSRAGPRSSGFVTSAARKRLRRRDDLQLAVGGPHGARPGLRAVHEHAVRERHPTEPDADLAHRRERSRSAACSRAASRAGPRRRRPALPSSETTGITSRTDEVVNASSARDELGERNVPSDDVGVRKLQESAGSRRAARRGLSAA